MKLILKISGEFLDRSESLEQWANNIHLLSKEHTVGVVVGGGNLVRGRNYSENRFNMDVIGMYSTILNGLLLQSLIPGSLLYNSFNSDYVKKIDVEKLGNAVTIFSGGIGVPYFSTDIAAVVRGIDMKADLILKATKTDGVYDGDPELNSSKLLKKTTYQEIIKKELKVIDLTAAALAAEHKMKIVIFNGKDSDNLFKAVKNDIGSIISV